MTRISRKKARPGMQVLVRTHDGRELTGTLRGWGSQLIDVAPDEAAKAAGWTWKRHSVWAGAEVYAI